MGAKKNTRKSSKKSSLITLADKLNVPILFKEQWEECQAMFEGSEKIGLEVEKMEIELEKLEKEEYQLNSDGMALYHKIATKYFGKDAYSINWGNGIVTKVTPPKNL